MQYQYYNLGNVEKGKVVEVTLGSAANVRLMDGSNYSNFKIGKKHKFYGGHVTTSPYEIAIPNNGNWHVVIDLGGHGGKISSSVRVL